MDIETLRLTLEVSRRLSFVAVASARGVDPSKVSRAVAQAEASLGARLFQRTTRRMSLTAAGERFCARLEGVIDAYDEARELARSDEARPRGRLRLTASTAFGETMIAPRLGDFRARYPDVTLDLRWADAAVDLIAEGVDLAVRHGPPINAGAAYEVRTLRPTRYVLCARPDWVAARRLIDPASLDGAPAVAYALPAPKTRWFFRRRGASHRGSIEIQPAAIAASPLTVLQLARSGVGPAIVADWLCGADLASGALVDAAPDFEFSHGDFDAAARMIFPRTSRVPRKTQAMTAFLKEALGARSNASRD
ncbi:MAG: LysR family transcriptional regulator [Parvularculaceae bacterium]